MREARATVGEVTGAPVMEVEVRAEATGVKATVGVRAAWATVGEAMGAPATVGEVRAVWEKVDVERVVPEKVVAGVVTEAPAVGSERGVDQAARRGTMVRSGSQVGCWAPAPHA